MERARLALLALAVGSAALTAACATTPDMDLQDPGVQLEFGLAALERQEFRTAFDHLTWVYTHHWDQPVGRRALVALAALELDPRNPSRRLGIGAELAAGYLRMTPERSWLDPVVSTMYLLALELGAAEERIAQVELERQAAVSAAVRAQAQARQAERSARQAIAQAQAQARAHRSAAAAAPPPRQIPSLPGPPITARIREVERERDRLAERVSALEREVAKRDEELARVRRALQN